MTIIGDNYGEIDALIEQYRDLQAEKDRQLMFMDEDAEINKLTVKFKTFASIAEEAASEVAERSSAYGIAKIEAKQNGLKEQIRTAWEDPAKKTYKSALGTVTLRTTKSLIVDSAKAVIEFLLKNDKCEEGIAKFNLPELRKFADADLLNKGATHYEEKQSISIKLVGAE